MFTAVSAELVLRLYNMLATRIFEGGQNWACEFYSYTYVQYTSLDATNKCNVINGQSNFRHKHDAPWRFRVWLSQAAL